MNTNATADLAAVLAAIEADAGTHPAQVFSDGGPSQRVHFELRNVQRVSARWPLYIALARAVAAERAAHAELDAYTETATPLQALYDARDAARDAVTVALAALAEGTS